MECLSPSSPGAWPNFAPNMTFATQLLLKKRQKKTELWRSIVSIELELECTCTEIFSTQNRFGSLVFQWKDLFPTEFAIFRIFISQSKVEFLAFFPAYRVMIALTAGMKFYQSNGAPFFDGMSCWFENVGSQIPHRIHNQTAFIGDILLVFTTRFMNTDYSKKVERNLIQTFCFQLQRARNINQSCQTLACKSGMRLCSRFFSGQRIEIWL